jgi:hypothetical protein
MLLLSLIQCTFLLSSNPPVSGYFPLISSNFPLISSSFPLISSKIPSQVMFFYLSSQSWPSNYVYKVSSKASFSCISSTEAGFLVLLRYVP